VSVGDEEDVKAQIMDDTASSPAGLAPIEGAEGIRTEGTANRTGTTDGEDSVVTVDPEPGEELPDTPSLPEKRDLQNALEAARVECAELREQLLRRKAEFDNYRRRVERDRQAAVDETRAEVIREFFPALDNLERALRAEGDEVSVRQGIEMVYGELGKALIRLGVRSHEPVGERFDPLSQQALLYEVVPGFADGTIVEVYRRSYHFGEQLLRPAMVKVAKGAEMEDEGDSEAGLTQ
jgi:molecular chaperone GrpE